MQWALNGRTVQGWVPPGRGCEGPFAGTLGGQALLKVAGVEAVPGPGEGLPTGGPWVDHLPPAGPGTPRGFLGTVGCSRAQAPPRGWAASPTHPRRQPETWSRHGGGGAAWGLQGPWSPRRPSPVMWGLGHGPAIVGGVADHAPQQRGLVHQLLGDAANVYASTAEAPPGAWGAGGARVSCRPADPNSAGQRAGLSPSGLMPVPSPWGTRRRQGWPTSGGRLHVVQHGHLLPQLGS